MREKQEKESERERERERERGTHTELSILPSVNICRQRVSTGYIREDDGGAAPLGPRFNDEVEDTLDSAKSKSLRPPPATNKLSPMSGS